MGRPKLSVVMPVHARPEMTQEAIASILVQDIGDFEFLIIDDASSENMQDMLNTCKDPRITTLRLPISGGEALARNVGLQAAQGEYIAVMDSDDVALPHRMSRQVAAMERSPKIAILGSWTQKFKGSKIQEMHHPEADAVIKARLLALDGSAMIHPSTMIRADFLKRHSLFYPIRRTDTDHGLWMEAMFSGAQFANYPEVLLRYRRHDGNITNTDKDRLHRDKLGLRQQIVARFFPTLTHFEATQLASVLQGGGTGTVAEACVGYSLFLKAATQKQSIFGESRPHVNQILKEHAERLRQKIAFNS